MNEIPVEIRKEAQIRGGVSDFNQSPILTAFFLKISLMISSVKLLPLSGSLDYMAANIDSDNIEYYPGNPLLAQKKVRFMLAK